MRRSKQTGTPRTTRRVPGVAKASVRRSIRLIGVLSFVAACHRGIGTITTLENGLRLRADSVQYSVRVDGPMYLAAIGFQFENNSGRTLSQNYCHSPPPPALEKQWANGEWVFAYSADPDDRAAPMIVAVSPPFTLVMQ